MAVSADILKGMLTEKFPDSEIEIIDLAGDGDHYEARITSAQFNGISKLAQHKLVYDALGNMVGGQLHALALKTTPR